MIKWVNYKALFINTSLTKQITIEPDKLIKFISSNTKELYHCYYDLEPRDSFVDYEGMLRPAFGNIVIDFDGSEKTGTTLDDAWNDTKAFSEKLESLNVPHNIHFSGNKGFHVEIHKSHFSITEGPKAKLEAEIKSICQNLKAIYKTIDTGIWNANRKLRAAGSRHPATNKFKTLLPIPQEARLLLTQEILTLAETRSATCIRLLEPVLTGVPWLESLKVASERQAASPKTSTKFLEPGVFIEDPSWKLRNFADKKCIKAMREQLLPQFNRHDIGLRLIYDLWSQGKPQSFTENKLLSWASEAFGADSDRIQDVIRMVHDAYNKPQDYKYGCYDDIKKAYCSARCKLFNSLDPSLRASPVDMTSKQKTTALEATEIPEPELADKILSDLGEIITSNGDFFIWKKTHWEKLDKDRFEYLLTDTCIKTYNNTAKYVKMTSLYRQVRAKIPVAPENNHFFSSSPNMFNFSDGTCVVTKNDKGHVTCTMKPHDKKDLLSYCAPFPLQAPHQLPVTGDFDHYMEARRQAFGEEDYQAVQEMFGAALIPYEPRIFILHGSSNTGKSTAAILVKKLLGDNNVSSVDPSSSYSFNWESCIGKIANIVTELSNLRPLQDDVLKKIRDKEKVYVNRKGVKAVDATLPFLHIYCCNSLPKSLEGNTGALDNRISLLEFKTAEINGLGSISGLAHWLWDRDPGSILNFARAGLASLMSRNFKYFVPESAKEKIKGWQEDSDPVAQFVQSVSDGELKIKADVIKFNRTDCVKADAIHAAYVTWAQECGYKVMGRAKFYRELERLCTVRPTRSERGKLISWPFVQGATTEVAF